MHAFAHHACMHACIQGHCVHSRPCARHLWGRSASHVVGARVVPASSCEKPESSKRPLPPAPPPAIRPSRDRRSPKVLSLPSLPPASTCRRPAPKAQPRKASQRCWSWPFTPCTLTPTSPAHAHTRTHECTNAHTHLERRAQSARPPGAAAATARAGPRRRQTLSLGRPPAASSSLRVLACPAASRRSRWPPRPQLLCPCRPTR